MKKILLSSALAITLFASVVEAKTGIVNQINVLSAGTVQVVIKESNGALSYGNLVGDAEKIKMSYALALTAYSSDATVDVGWANEGWDRISLMPKP